MSRRGIVGSTGVRSRGKAGNLVVRRGSNCAPRAGGFPAPVSELVRARGRGETPVDPARTEGIAESVGAAAKHRLQVPVASTALY